MPKSRSVFLGLGARARFELVWDWVVMDLLAAPAAASKSSAAVYCEDEDTGGDRIGALWPGFASAAAGLLVERAWGSQDAGRDSTSTWTATATCSTGR